MQRVLLIALLVAACGGPTQSLTLDISSDIVTAIEWHIERGYSGSESKQERGGSAK